VKREFESIGPASMLPCDAIELKYRLICRHCRPSSHGRRSLSKVASRQQLAMLSMQAFATNLASSSFFFILNILKIHSLPLTHIHI
jgi:hypothetical protein